MEMSGESRLSLTKAELAAKQFWKDLASLASQRRIDHSFSPGITAPERIKRMREWHRAVERAKGWAVESAT